MSEWSVPSVLGMIGTVIGLVRAVPQLARLLRAREAFGVSVDTAATSAIVSCFWVVYGWLTGQTYVVLSTGSTMLVFALIAFFALRFGRSLRELKIAPFWLLVLMMAAGLAGVKGLGAILSISVLVSNVPQLWVAYKEGNLADLSLGTWSLCTLDGLVWGLYALLQQDPSILSYGIFQFSTSGLIVILKLMHQSRQSALPGADVS